MAKASERTIVTGPDGVDRVIAAGDDLDALGFVGVISNTPNKVDAAANYDVVDAADKAADRPTQTVVQQLTGTRDADALTEIRERVAANREEFDSTDYAATSSNGSDGSESGSSSYDARPKAELRALADERGLDVPPTASKSTLADGLAESDRDGGASSDAATTTDAPPAPAATVQQSPER